MRRLASLVVVVAVIGLIGFLYLTRPVAAPSQDVTKNAPPADTALEGQKTEGVTVYKIDASKSNAQFEIDEILYGEPKHVVGVTDQVTGEVLLNTAKPSESKLGKITVNARTLKTDNERRNGALARLILKSEDAANEYISFESTGLTGMPETIKADEEFSFKINGNLTVSGVTKPATFDAKAKLSGDQLTGSTKATVMYKDFGLKIPNLSFLAGVHDDVLLTFNFVAVKQ